MVTYIVFQGGGASLAQVKQLKTPTGSARGANGWLFNAAGPKPHSQIMLTLPLSEHASHEEGWYSYRPAQNTHHFTFSCLQASLSTPQTTPLPCPTNILSPSPSGGQMGDLLSHLLAWLPCEKTLSLQQIWHLSFWLATFWANEPGLLTRSRHHPASGLSGLVL